MGAVLGDLIIKSCIEASIADLKANVWILDDIFEFLASDPLIAHEYGYKEVAAAKRWFLTHDFPVLMQGRISDDPPVPCISVSYLPTTEIIERASLGDEGYVEGMDVTGVVGTPVKVYDNFTPKKYNKNTGLVTMPDHLDNDMVSPGQFFVTAAGNAYKIYCRKDKDSFEIKKGTSDDFTDAYIIPANKLWNLHKEATYESQGYSVGCHAQGNAAYTLWLWMVVVYSFYRYKQHFLEERGFTLSTISSTALELNADFPAEKVFSRYITIQGQTQLNWIKFIAPRFEEVRGGIAIADGPKAPPGVYGEGQAWHMQEDYEDGEAFSSFGCMKQGEDDE